MKKNNMKIAMIIPSLLTGGGQKVAMDIAQNDPQFIFIVIGKKQDNFFSKVVESSHKVYYMNKELGFDPRTFFRIWKILIKEKPNIIHFHLGVSLYGLVPCFVMRKIKLIYTFHTVAEKDSQGIIRRLCYIGIKYRKMIPVAITETVRESILRLYHVDNVKLIYNGIELSKYYSLVDKNNQELQLIAVGQIWEAKNHFFLIDVMVELTRKYSYQKYKLIILGDGPLKNELEKYITECDMDGFVELKGNVDNVEKYLARADIFVLSSHYEGLSLATMEAMASCLPIVSTDVGGMKDLVKDNGFLVTPGNVAEFANKIAILGENSKLRKKMGENSVYDVKKYDVQLMRNEYMKLYEKIRGR